MHLQDVLYFLLWAGLFFVMMRFGCGAHVMGHGHHHGAPGQDHGPRTGSQPLPPDQATDPVCGMNVRTATAKTAVYQGQSYYFCSQSCREKFEMTPHSYAKSASVASH